MADSEVVKLHDRYPWKCPSCESEYEGAPSPAMECGVNHSYTVCEVCGARIHLEITPDLTGSEFAAEEYNAYCDRIQAEKSEVIDGGY